VRWLIEHAARRAFAVLRTPIPPDEVEKQGNLEAARTAAVAHEDRAPGIQHRAQAMLDVTSATPSLDALVPLVAPERAAVTATGELSEREVRAAFAAALAAPPPATTLLPPSQMPGARIVAERLDGDETVWSLSNRAEVRIAPARDASGVIEIEAWSPGGALGLADADLGAAVAIVELSPTLGAGALEAPERKRYEEAHDLVGLGLQLEAHRQGLVLGTRGDLEPALALIHALMAQPMRDDALAAASMIEPTDFWAPELPLRLAVELGFSIKAKVTAARAWELLRARFGHAAGYVFTLRGIDPGDARDAVTRYLATLPMGVADRATAPVQLTRRYDFATADGRCELALSWTGVAPKLLPDGSDPLDIARDAFDTDDRDFPIDVQRMHASPDGFVARTSIAYACDRTDGEQELRTFYANRVALPLRHEGMTAARHAALVRLVAPGSHVVAVKHTQ
jgi:hypothetical protein